MAEVEDRQFNSLAERIAALNQQKNFSSNGKRAPPPPPPGRPKSEAPTSNGSAKPLIPAQQPRNPVIPARPQKRENNPPPALPRRTTNDVDATGTPPGIRPPPPPLPTRTNTQSSLNSPALPPRRPSTQTLGTRRGSNASDMSHMSVMSNLSLNQISSRTSTTSTETQPGRKLPPTLDQAKLPPLPPSRKDREAAQEAAQRDAGGVAPMRSIKSAPVVPQVQQSPSLPPRLPSRPVKSPPQPNNAVSQARRLPPPPSGGYSRPGSTFESNRPNDRVPDSPPPVPVSSRPSMAQIDAVATRAAATQAAAAAVVSCLICRDFSRPDAVAAQFPNHTLPRNDPVGYLANVLCGSFPSATDKARAIFTWCHHNIAYNVEEFFGKCIKGRSVEETIFHGKAVCQGYAEVYQSIARRAGLQCVVVGGHGKGYGYTPLKDGEAPPPRDPSGHAWNAVMIDDGEWKLLDACWGAGNVGDGTYNKAFKPEMFYLSNELFGLKHFPSDSRHFYRSDGSIPTWEEYMIGPTRAEKAVCYGTATDEGLSAYTFSPAEKHIRVNSGEVVRFQFSKVCEHWVPEKHGRGPNYLLMMKIRGLDGRKDDLVVLETDGFWWWTDIRARDLGAPGQKIWLYGLNRLNNKDVRGLSKQEYLRTIGSGSYSMSWECYFEWELV
ncbi:Kyphoscoliosis peptidase [Apiospora aurea]|uniref:Kyphoscoliosis peptidase n=1 Tax=Apiospora aurea TaxID=335848 RepID=A0ABR1QIN2_9PEZI